MRSHPPIAGVFRAILCGLIAATALSSLPATAAGYFLPLSAKKRPTGVTTSAQTRDNDRDGLSNWTEVRRTGTNPNRRDTDRDGLSDGVEVRRTKTDPRQRDTDRDGSRDGAEVRAGSDPRDPASVPGGTLDLPAPLQPAPSPTTEAPVEEEPPPPPPAPDTTAPDTQITGRPGSPVNSAAASFSFTGTDNGSGVASFQCKLDSGVFAACTSPREYTGLSEGSHSFEVRAVDAADNTDASPATHAWTVDTTPPAIQIDSGPNDLTNDSTPSFAFSAAGATFECSVDKGTASFGPCSGASSHTPSPALADGAWTFRARASDPAGNQAIATRGFSVDTTAPDTQIGAKPVSLVNSAAASFSFTGSDPGGSGIASFQCKLDSGSFAACAPPREHTGLSESAHSFEVRAIDNAGNADASPATHAWTVDLTPPTLSISSGPDGLTNDPTPTFAFSAEAGATRSCSLDSGPPSFGPCSTPGSHTPAGPLAEGSHTFRVRAGDAAGNEAVATRSFTVDTTLPPAPELSATDPASPSNHNQPLILGSAQAGATVRVYAGGTCSGAPIATVSPAALEAGVQATVPNDSTTVFRATATTTAGNVSGCSEPLAYVEDSTAPVTQVVSQPPALTNSTAASFSFTGSDPGSSGIASFQCKLDSGSFAACTSPREYTSLAEGPHSFEVRAVDQAGNTDATPAGFSWTVDLTPPSVQVDSGPTGLTNDSTPTFAFGAETSAALACSIDKGTASFAPCSGAAVHTPAPPLADGAWTFRVRASDAAGNQAVATRDFQVDTSAPASPTLGSTSPASPANDNTPLVVGSAPVGSTVRLYASASCSGAPLATVAAAALEDGVEVTVGEDAVTAFSATATDTAGNPSGCSASISYREDSTAPGTQITGQPGSLVNSANATFSFSGTDPGGSGIASFQCKLDSGVFATCTSPREYTSLAEGPHSFEVRGIDQAGNADATPASFEWAVDTTPPTVQIDSGPTGLTGDSTPTFTFSASGATFTCSIDKGTASFAPCSGAAVHTPAPPLADGAWTFRVRASDAAGNQAVVTRSFTVDTAAPSAPLLTGTSPASPANDDTPLVLGSAPAGSTVRLYASAGCSGAPLATITAAALEAGVEVTVGEDAVTAFSATATDTAGNPSGCSASISYREDSTAPGTQITGQPESLVNTATATFSFTGSDPGGSGVSSFQCKLDSGAFATCTSPREYTGLTEGSHSFEVQAIDGAGNTDATPATHAWTVDTTPPPVQIDSGPTGLTGDSTPTFTFSATGATFECSIDTGTAGFAPCSAAGSHTPASPLADGPRTFRVRATDQAGNQATATRSFTVDATAPATQITAQPPALTNSTAASFSFTGTDGTGIASFQCKLDSGAFATCTPPREYTSLAEGPHSFEVRAVDQAGNTDATPASFSWTVDLTPPALSISSGPDGLTNDSTPTFTFSAAGAGFECSIDKGTANFGACSSAGAHSPSPALADGAWTFRVRATDLTGNQSVATRSFTVDTAAPAAPTLTGTVPGSPASDNTPLVVGNAAAETTVRLYSGGCSGSPTATVGAAALAAGVEIAVPDDSTTVFRATATTTASNASGCSEPLTYVEDSTAPGTQLMAQPPALTNSPTATFSFNGTDPGGSGASSFQCKLDSGSFTTCTSPREYTSLGEGSHSFEVRAIDGAGNTDAGPAAHAWTVDLTPPTVQIDSGPTGLTNDSTPTFTFGAEADAALACSIDKGTASFAPCSAANSHTPSPALADSTWTFRLRATDAAGNQATATRGFSVDATAPDTQIGTKPASPVKSAAASLSFTGSDPSGSGVASFQCRLDGGAFAACTSPRDYTGLSEGSHSFEVRAVDHAGNTDAGPAAHTWTVDLTPPAVQIDGGPTGLTGDSTPTFVFSSAGASFECSVDTGTPVFGPCSGTGSHTPASPLADGPRTFRVRATDPAGNQATVTRGFTVDATPPNTQIGAKPASLTNSATATFSFTGDDGAGSGVSSLQCKLDSGAFATCTSPREYTGLSEGSHSFEVRAIDAAGNTDAGPAAHAWTVDLTPPTVQIDSGPTGLTNDSTPTFTFGAEAGAAPACSIDKGTASFAPCSGAAAHTPSPALADSAWTFRVRATDAAGNQATATRGFTVDTVPPASPTLGSTSPASPANDDTPLVLGSAPAGSTVRLYASADCSGVPLATVTAAALGAGVEVAVGEDAVTAFSATATDTAGNPSGCSASISYREDSTLPGTQITGQPGSLVNSAAATFSFSGSDPGGSGVSSFQCKLDGGAFAACTSPRDYTALTDGSHNFEVRAIDGAGNTDATPATHAWTVDTTPPPVQIDSGPTGLTGDSTPTFAFSASGATFECSIDKGTASFAPCSSAGSHTPSPALADGAWTFRVRASDPAGNQATATRGFSVDATAPDTQIGTKPATLINSAAASFSFTGTDPGGSGIASFQCKLDSGAFATCTSPREYSSLAAGSHSFEVRAIDAAGNTDASPAAHAWIVDLTPPTVQIDSGPTGLTIDSTPTFTFGAEAGAALACSIDKGTASFAPCSAASSHTPSPALADGAWTFRVRATDAAGNQVTATRGFSVDATAPATQITDQPPTLTSSTAASFSFNGSDAGGSGVASFECRLDSAAPGAWAACTSPRSFSGLADGAHSFDVRAIDGAGNIDATPGAHSWTVDTTAPAVQIDSGPTGPTSGATPTFAFSAPGASFECSIDTGTPSFGPCSAAGSHTPASPLADGAWTFRVRATGQAGSQAIATRAFTVDTIAPDTEIGTKPTSPFNSAAASFSFTGSDPGGSGIASLQCKLDSGAFATCTSPREYTGLSEGSHSFEVRAVDQAGNADQSPATHAWQVDVTAPQVSIDSVSKTVLKAAETSALSWHAGENGAFSLRLGGANCDAGTVLESGAYGTAPTQRVSNVAAAQLAEGVNTLRLCLTDAAGNRGSATTTLRRDTKAPTTQVTAQPPALTNSTAASFAFTGSDSGGSGIASFSCRLDGSAFSTCTSPRSHTGLSEGIHVFEVSANDQAGNSDQSPVEIEWEIDLTPPSVSIERGPDGLTSNPTPTFSFSAPGATFECSVDKGTPAFAPCSAAGSHTPGAPLADGSHTFRVRATDAAGNTAVATRGFTVDTTLPQAPELSATVPASPANHNQPLILGTAPAGTTVRVYAGGTCLGDPVATLSPAALETGLEATVPDDSTTVFRATATTTAESTSGCSEPLSYVEDSTAPQVTLTSPPPATTHSTSATFFLTASEPGTGFECALDGEPLAACGTPRSYANLAPGPHSFTARATDAAGNVDSTPATVAWTIEPPPVAPSACVVGSVQATTAAAILAAVQDGEDVCVTAEVGTVDLRNLGSRPVVISTEGGSMGDVNILSTTDLTVSQARLRSVEMRNAHRTMLLDNVIGGTQAARVPDQLIFMPGESDDVVIEGNDVGWTVADESGNAGYGCRCYGDLDRLRFVGNRLHDLAADGFQGVGGVDVVIDRNEIGPVGRNPESDEHTDNIQITGNEQNLRITNNWIHHQGYYEGNITANAGSTYIHGGSSASLVYENNLIEATQGRTEVCGLGTGGVERSNLTIRRNTWVDGGLAFNSFPGFEWDCDSGAGNTITRNISIDPDGGIADNGYDAALVAPNLFGKPSLVTLDADRNCTSANCNPLNEEPLGYRKPSGVDW